MSVAGIVAEYNPFHTGHAYHIAQTRRALGEDAAVICVMSGNWVQRGECALTDKWTRAGLALRGGADLVLELPLPWAVASAEAFARGAVGLLKATGVVDTLSFGSESGRSADLRRIAAAVESEEFRDALRGELDKGRPFAQARQRAAARVVGQAAALLERPNDSLAVEYIRAAGEDLNILAIPRQGTAHDSPAPEGGFASASYLREALRRGEDASHWLLPVAGETLRKASLTRMENVERAVLSRLRTMTEGDFAALTDSAAAEGLPRRLVRAARQAGSLAEFYDLAKTKRYAHARIRRLALRAFLGLREGDAPKNPQYLRVLAFNGRGRALLKEMKGRAALPLLTKPAHVRALSGEAQVLFELESRATDLFGLCFDTVRPCGMDYTTGPVKE